MPVRQENSISQELLTKLGEKLIRTPLMISWAEGVTLSYFALNLDLELAKSMAAYLGKIVDEINSALVTPEETGNEKKEYYQYAISSLKKLTRFIEKLIEVVTSDQPYDEEALQALWDQFEKTLRIQVEKRTALITALTIDAWKHDTLNAKPAVNNIKSLIDSVITDHRQRISSDDLV